MGSPDLFDDIKTLCKNKKSDIPSVVDDVHGAQNISNHFKSIYENLYNEQEEVKMELVNNIYASVESDGWNSIETINLFTKDLIKTAVKMLKTDKTDVSGQFTSDCLKFAPDLFFVHLAELFRSYLFHGYICHDLIICALTPIIKDSNGDVSSSKNYRGIAISSLILKVFDNCLLFLFGKILSNNDLQFGFQKGCSTVQCTWAVQETISHYLRNDSEVFCCLLDFSKAFDKVNFNELFKKLMERNMPAVILRLVLFVYVNQSCFIRWNSVMSDSFSVRNGVRQGAILSPSLFCVYLDTLLIELRKLGIGCHLGNRYLGVFGYADDVIILSPTREGLQLMLKVCEDFAQTHSMLFSTDSDPAKSKTKCLFFSRNRSAEAIENVKLNGNDLP